MDWDRALMDLYLHAVLKLAGALLGKATLNSLKDLVKIIREAENELGCAK